MYEIYSNVEDPDGFYGIQTNDAKSALLRRLDHEGQYWRAFGYNGAAIESGGSYSRSPALAVLHNLHSFGFNKLASGVMRSARGTDTDATMDDPLIFDLAWRTGDWELPLTTEASKTPAGLFYSALRAVHRERDKTAARAVVNVAIQAEMGHLEELGLERMAEIKRTSVNLICLRDVALWLSDSTQKALENGSFEDVALTRFATLNSGFEWV
jgi:ataxia telangiectasia mutated family protein